MSGAGWRRGVTCRMGLGPPGAGRLTRQAREARQPSAQIPGPPRPLMRDPQAELHVSAQDGPGPELASEAGQDAGIDIEPQEPMHDLIEVEGREERANSGQ